MREIQPLYLLSPDALPQSRDEIRALRVGPVCEALRLSTTGPGSSDEETLSRLRAALEALPPPERSPACAPAEKPTADRDAHDRYCRIVRMNGDRSHAIYVHSVLRAYAEMIEDMLEGGTTLSARLWGQLRAAFDSTLLSLNDDFMTMPAPEEDVLPASIRWRQGQRCDPLGRWIRGHHIFLVLIQSVITSLNCFLSAYKARDLELSAATLDLTTRLFDGCSAALHFAGDFSPTEYEKIVRPSMMPPNAPPGMSGVLARDHEHLAHLLRGQQQVFAHLDPSLKEHYGRFVSAFGNTYEAHKLVCSRFVGDERPSLLNRNEEAEAAVEVLDKVKASRLRSFQEL